MAFKKIRVLIVDDSLLFRQTLAQDLSKDFGIEVIGMAEDPYAAVKIINQLHPDVITLDVEMPKMSGIEFLKRVLPQYPLPVVVVSSVAENVFNALDAGAVDFVTKPSAAADRRLLTSLSERLRLRPPQRYVNPALLRALQQVPLRLVRLLLRLRLRQRSWTAQKLSLSVRPQVAQMLFTKCSLDFRQTFRESL